MPFEIQVCSHSPIVSNNLDEILERFLLDIGFLSGRKRGEELYESIPFKLWTECLLDSPEKSWTVDELSETLEASKPTIYRHLNKLKNLDMVEAKEVVEEDNGEVIKKGYRLRHGDLMHAWYITEANIESAVKRYRETVANISELIKGE